ncbi:MAG: RDD family protein [Actinomycetota bacterium]
MVRRIFAFLIDCAIPLLFLALFVGLATAFGSGDEASRLESFFNDLSEELSVTWGALEMAGLFLVGLAGLWWTFGLTLMEWRFGRTPGKAMLHLRAVSEDGTALSFGQAVVRRLTLVFSGPLQLIDWAFALFDPRRQRAVEKLAHTLVIHDEVPDLRSAIGAGVLA